jgi:hypothetical protein
LDADINNLPCCGIEKFEFRGRNSLRGVDNNIPHLINKRILIRRGLLEFNWELGEIIGKYVKKYDRINRKGTNWMVCEGTK